MLVAEPVISGVGLGLRSSFATALAQRPDPAPVRFLEFSPENVLDRGGLALNRFVRLADKYPLISHGLSLNLGGTDPLDEPFLARMRELFQRFSVPWHSDHLCFCAHDGVALHDLLPLPFTRATADRVADRVRRSSEILRRPVAVENISYYLHMGRSELKEPEFVTRVLEQADCPLLLDVNNIAINARNFGFDPFDWLDRIPLERVIQLHVAGGEYSPTHGVHIDTHGADTTSEVVSLMQWVIERTGPLPVLLERDNNIPPLDVLVDQVSALQAAYDDALVRAGHPVSAQPMAPTPSPTGE